MISRVVSPRLAVCCSTECTIVSTACFAFSRYSTELSLAPTSSAWGMMAAWLGGLLLSCSISSCMMPSGWISLLDACWVWRESSCDNFWLVSAWQCPLCALSSATIASLLCSLERSSCPCCKSCEVPLKLELAWRIESGPGADSELLSIFCMRSPARLVSAVSAPVLVDGRADSCSAALSLASVVPSVWPKAWTLTPGCQPNYSTGVEFQLHNV